MILDTLKNSARYCGMNPAFKEAFAFLERAVRENLPDGRYELDGDKLYAMVQAYETKNEADTKWEAHKKYIDIQFMISGTEIIGWDSIDNLPADQVYNEEYDCYVYQAPSATALILESGTFAVFYPEDLHKPGQAYPAPAPIKKVVVKIKL